jgi:hypothetical protein
MSKLSVSSMAGKRGAYISVVLWHTYALTRVAADYVYGRASGGRFTFDIAFAGLFTALWVVSMTKRFVSLGIDRWWVLPYAALFASLALVLRRSTAVEITIAIIVWFALQLPVMIRRPKETSGSGT